MSLLFLCPFTLYCTAFKLLREGMPHASHAKADSILRTSAHNLLSVSKIIISNAANTLFYDNFIINVVINIYR